MLATGCQSRPSPTPNVYGVAATSTSPVWRFALQPAPTTEAPRGDVTLRWRLDPTSSFTGLTLRTGIAGVSTGPKRDDNWSFVPSVGDVHLEPGGPAVEVARGTVPAQGYLRVFASADDVVADDGTVIDHFVEPAVLHMTVDPSTTTVVDIDLIVLPRADSSGGGYRIFVRDAQVAASG
jgi:hypothetical protein